MHRTPEAYQAAFELEAKNEYPVIDSLEERYGYKMNRGLLESAARVLACPLKRNPPNWQHGRLIYALARHRLAMGHCERFLDIGTAKGFSSVCMAWAAQDSGSLGIVIDSIDVIDPKSNEPRNSVIDGTVRNGIRDYVLQFLPPVVGPVYWSERVKASYGPDDWFGFAFIDGSHTYEGVKSDIELVVPRQKVGDVILFDDFNLIPVADAVRAYIPSAGYILDEVTLIPGKRSYAIATRVA